MSIQECTHYDRCCAIQQRLIALATKEPEKKVSDFVPVACPLIRSVTYDPHSDEKLTLILAPIPPTRSSTEPKEDDAVDVKSMHHSPPLKGRVIVDPNGQFAKFLTTYYTNKTPLRMHFF